MKIREQRRPKEQANQFAPCNKYLISNSLVLSHFRI